MANSIGMKLADYLEQEDLRPSVFAERIKVPASTITRILSGERIPRLRTIAKITKGSKGAVTYADFLEDLEPEPKPRKRSSRSQLEAV
jgi:predicted transcriptional regulator